MTRGRFITIEGGEGTGKSTLISSLADHMVRSGIDVLVTREPGGTPLAERVRALVLAPPEDDHWSPIAEALLMNAARADHVERKIAPALEADTWVICDRFIDSTRVYQGIGGVNAGLLELMQREVTTRAFPDLTLVLDAPVEQLRARRESRGTTDVFESKPAKFHEAVRQRFLDIAHEDSGRCVIIDALQSPEDVLQAALEAIRERCS